MNVHVSVLQEEEIKVGLESEIIQVEGTVSGDYIPVPSTAAVGQTIVVKAVDENGKPTEWEAADMPSGGGGASVELDTTLTQSGKAADAKAVGYALADKQPKGDYLTQDELPDMTAYRTAEAQNVIDARKQDTLIQSGATVGQIAKITAVDENGKPTEWEAVDMASAGGEEAWDYEKTILIEEEVASLTIDTFDDGTPLALKKVEVILVGSNATSANQSVALTPDYNLAGAGGEIWLGGGSYLTANKKHYLWGIAEINNGEVAAEFAQRNNQTQFTNYYNGISSAITKVKPGITFSGDAAEIYPRKATKFISIKAEVPAGAFAVGTILRIKGVMA